MSEPKPIIIVKKHGIEITPDGKLCADVVKWQSVICGKVGDTVKKLMLAGFCCLFMVGCDVSLTRPLPVTPDDKPAPVVQPLDAEAVFHAIADRSGPGKWIKDTDRLARVVKQLEPDVPGISAKFDEKFAKDLGRTRELTADDVATLKGMK